MKFLPAAQDRAIALALVALFLAAVLARPLLPIDETRYLTVAWEMHLRHDWLAPLTVNFALYHHKPPMLFWLINLCWSVFGISRWAAIIPIFAAAAANMVLARALATKLFPADPSVAGRVPLLMLGSVPFLIYSTLMMFDVMMSAFVLGVFFSMFRFMETRRFRWTALSGLLLGLAVLTKGPVAYLYVLFPMLFAKFWAGEKRPGIGYVLAALGLSLIPILFWLIPVLSQSDNKFAFWLLWEQTAGRVTGNFSSSHARPVYFYLPLLPVMFLPWAFFPAFWQGLKAAKDKIGAEKGLRFLAIWLIPVFVSFSLISGKQPHYLVPLLPGGVVLTAWLLRGASVKMITRVAAVFVALIIGGQAIAAQTFFRSYDLTPVATYVSAHQDADWAFVRNYNGELGFLARLEKPLDNRDLAGMKTWFEQHPDGLAVMRYKNLREVAAYEAILTMKYRGRNIGIFRKK